MVKVYARNLAKIVLKVFYILKTKIPLQYEAYYFEEFLGFCAKAKLEPLNLI